jgi:hypothetical protein
VGPRNTLFPNKCAGLSVAGSVRETLEPEPVASQNCNCSLATGLTGETADKRASDQIKADQVKADEIKTHQVRADLAKAD